MSDLVDWADLKALAMAARDWFDDRDRPVAALLGTALGRLPVSPAYMVNVLRTAAALRSAYAAGQRDPSLLRSEGWTVAEPEAREVWGVEYGNCDTELFHEEFDAQDAIDREEDNGKTATLLRFVYAAPEVTR